MAVYSPQADSTAEESEDTARARSRALAPSPGDKRPRGMFEIQQALRSMRSTNAIVAAMGSKIASLNKSQRANEEKVALLERANEDLHEQSVSVSQGR